MGAECAAITTTLVLRRLRAASAAFYEIVSGALTAVDRVQAVFDPLARYLLCQEELLRASLLLALQTQRLYQPWCLRIERWL